MIDHIWTVLCLRSIRDGETNNISLIDVIESLQLEVGKKGKAKGKYAVPFPLYLVTLWGRAEKNKPSRGHGKDAVLSPSGEIIMENEYEIDLSVYERYRFTRKLDVFPVQESGRYQFRTRVRDDKRDDWEVVSVVPLDVTIKMQETTE